MRIQPNSFSVVQDGGVIVAFVAESDLSVVVDIRILRIQPNRFGEVLDGGVIVAFVAESAPRLL